MPLRPLVIALLALLLAAVPATDAAAAGKRGHQAHPQGPVRKRGPQRGIARVPRSFFGLVSEDAFWGTDEVAAEEVMQALARTGAGTVRQTFAWSHVETSPGTYDFALYDDFVLDAAAAGLEVLPVLFDPPDFRSSRPAHHARPGTYPPSEAWAMAEYAAALVRRYGPGGSLWAEHPEVLPRPVRAWQVWAEPNLAKYWPAGPSPRAYVRLLKKVAKGIRRVDRRAEVVTGGLPRSRHGMAPERYLARMYRAGARGHFDTLGVHPYASTAESMIDGLRTLRRVMNAHGDRRAGMRATEIGWATGGPRGSLQVGESGQAEAIRQCLRRLVASRRSLRMRGVVYYAWRDAAPYVGVGDFWGLHTGLLDRLGRPKLGYGAWVGTVRALSRSPRP